MSSSARRCRGDSASVLVEFALVLPILALLALGTADVARAYTLRNRLAGAAREAAAVAQFLPSSYDASCTGAGTRNIKDNAIAQDPGLQAMTGFSVSEQRKKADGSLGAKLTSCPTGNDLAVSGDRVIVAVSVTMPLLTPLARTVLGEQSIKVTATSEVVVQ